MKHIHFAFVIFLAFCNASEKSSLQKAFVRISEALAKRNWMVSFVTIGAAGSEVSMAGIPHVVFRFDNEPENFQLNSSAIVAMDSFESLEIFNNRTRLPSTFSMSQQLIIYCQDATFDKMASMKAPTLDFNPGTIVQYEYFVIEEEKSIRLLTFSWFTLDACNVPQLVDVNKFDKTSGRWEHGNFVIDKFSNFHGCQISFLLNPERIELREIVLDDEKREMVKCSGSYCAMVEDFSKNLNYTLHMNIEVERIRVLFPEVPYQLELLNMPVGTKYSEDPENKFVVTRPIQWEAVFITVPPGEEYNSYEKMALPFDEETWICIAITFASAFVTIFVLRFVRRDIANFVIGTDTETPALNVLRAFFGISQIVCPARNFARYMLMMFILFSLVIRTAYQGKMFEFLQKEMRRTTVTTSDEMIEQDFTFYLLQGVISAYKNFDFMKKAKIREFNDNTLFFAFQRAYIPGSKTAVLYTPNLYFTMIKWVLERNDPPKLLRDRFMLESQAAAFPSRHFLFNIFDRKLQQYLEANLIEYNTRDWIEMNNPKRYEEYKEPFAILKLEELEAGFVVSMLPLVLSILVFFIEWIPTLKNLVVFLYIFKAYFKMKHTELFKIGQFSRKFPNNALDNAEEGPDAKVEEEKKGNEDTQHEITKK